MNNNGKRHAQKTAFARAATLVPRLETVGLSEDALWQWVKDRYNVSSRSELTEEQWVVMSARFFAAQHNTHLFGVLCDTLRVYNTTHELDTASELDTEDQLIVKQINKDPRLHAKAVILSQLRRHSKYGVDIVSIDELVETAERYAPHADPVAYAQYIVHLEKEYHNRGLQDMVPVQTCKVFRRNMIDQTLTKVYEGPVTDDITDRCQKHADLSKCDVELHTTGEPRIFFPIEYERVPGPRQTPEDMSAPSRVFEIIKKENEEHRIELMFPNTARLEDWCRQYVREHGNTVIVTDWHGHYALMRFVS